jgi:bacillithiol system protein YtxJ
MDWLIVSDEDQLKSADARSFEAPSHCVLLFKHSGRCSISMLAKDRLERKWGTGALEIPTYYIDVLGSRDISMQIAQQYDTEHQSPQVLLIRDGKCVYTASHSGISFDEISDFLKS